MPKLENGLNGSFRVDGFGYQKGDYEPDYGKGSKFGLRRKGTRGEDSDYLVKPLPPGEWTDNTDTPFASVAAISTYLESFFFRKTATSLVTNEEVVNTYNDLPDPTLHNGEFWVVLTTTNNGSLWPFRVTYSQGTWRSNGTIWEFKGANIPAYLIDEQFYIRDQDTPTKQLGFEVSGLTGSEEIIVPTTPQIIDAAERREFRNVLSTGLHEFNGGITVNGGDNTLIDIPSLDGAFIDSTTDPINPTFVDVSFAAKPAYDLTTTASPGDFVAIYLSYDINGNVIEQTTPLTDEQRRDYIDIGLVVRDGNDDSIFLIVNTISNFGLNVAAQLHDLLVALGTFNISDNDVTPNANLTFDISSGVMWQNGANALSNPKDPHKPTQSAQSPTTFGLKLSDGTDIGLGTNVNPTIWDDGTSTPATVTNNNFTVQRVARFPDTGFVEILLGQEEFNTKQAALDAIGSRLARDFVVPDDSKLSVPLYWLVVKKEVTDLTVLTDAEFVPIIGLVR